MSPNKEVPKPMGIIRITKPDDVSYDKGTPEDALGKSRAGRDVQWIPLERVEAEVPLVVIKSLFPDAVL